MESQRTSFIDVSYNTLDKAEVADSNKYYLSKFRRKLKEENSAKKIKKKTVLIVGDSMVNCIKESKLSKARHIRVQPLSGANIED